MRVNVFFMSFFFPYWVDGFAEIVGHAKKLNGKTQ